MSEIDPKIQQEWNDTQEAVEVAVPEGSLRSVTEANLGLLATQVVDTDSPEDYCI